MLKSEAAFTGKMPKLFTPGTTGNVGNGGTKEKPSSVTLNGTAGTTLGLQTAGTLVGQTGAWRELGTRPVVRAGTVVVMRILLSLRQLPL